MRERRELYNNLAFCDVYPVWVKEFAFIGSCIKSGQLFERNLFGVLPVNYLFLVAELRRLGILTRMERFIFDGSLPKANGQLGAVIGYSMKFIT